MEGRAVNMLRKVVHMYYEAGSPASHTPIVEEWLKVWAANWSLHPDVDRATRESLRFSLLLVENPICDQDDLKEALESFLEASIEHLARITLRDFLFEHYINGLEHGELVERWLRDHGGWFPDQQQRWDCPMPKDEGIECHSHNPQLAIREAFRVIQLVLASCKEANTDQLRDFDLEVSEQLLEHISNYFKYLNSFELDVAALKALGDKMCLVSNRIEPMENVSNELKQRVRRVWKYVARGCWRCGKDCLGFSKEGVFAEANRLMQELAAFLPDVDEEAPACHSAAGGQAAQEPQEAQRPQKRLRPNE
jgi:hypothetical protein